MTYQNDKEAYCLANTYGFLLPHAVYPARIRRTDPGKYEPDHFPAAELRCMVLAHYAGKTNAIVQYNPYLNFVIPYHVTGTLTPDAAKNYKAFNGYAPPPGGMVKLRVTRPTYVSLLRLFFIWWDGVDSWILNYQIGQLDGPYWKRTHASMVGGYAPYAGAVGTATVVVGVIIPYHVAGTLTPNAAKNFVDYDTYEGQPTYTDINLQFFIWWGGVDTWFISDAVGWNESPCWYRTDPSMAGVYAPYAGATGIATVVAGPI